MGCSLSGTGCSSVGPPWGHKPCQQTCSGVGSSLHGSAGPARSLLQHGLPMGSQLPSGIHLLRCGVVHKLHVDICSTVDLHGCRGTTCLTMVFHHKLQGNTLCSGMGSLPQATGGYLLHHGRPWTAGGNLPHHGLQHELHGKTLCYGILSTYSPLLY